MKALIKKLTEIHGPSGYETKMCDFIKTEIASYVDAVEVDAMGNLHAIKNGSGEGQTIMLAAHMDEIGLMVTHVDEEGFARFTNLGGLSPYNLVGSRVIFANGTVGMINKEPEPKEPEGGPRFKNLYIDVGATDRENCPIKIGDVGNFFGPPIEIGNRIMAKSLDDRIGCAIQIETIKRLKSTPHQVHFVFTVQEEVGVRGATTSTFKVEPDIGIAIDITSTGDVPGIKNFPIALGKGAAIKVKDRGNLTHPAVKDWMIETAEANEIPYQLEILLFGGTDAGAMQLARSGVAVGCISIPCRHAHSPSEIIDLADVESIINLLVAMLSKVAPKTLQ